MQKVIFADFLFTCYNFFFLQTCLAISNNDTNDPAAVALHKALLQYRQGVEEQLQSGDASMFPSKIPPAVPLWPTITQDSVSLRIISASVSSQSFYPDVKYYLVAKIFEVDNHEEASKNTHHIWCLACDAKRSGCQHVPKHFRLAQ